MENDVLLIDKNKSPALKTERKEMILERECLRDYAETQKHNRQMQKNEQDHRHLIEDELVALERRAQYFSFAKFILVVVPLLIGLAFYIAKGGQIPEIPDANISAIVSFTVFAGILVTRLSGSGQKKYLLDIAEILAIWRKSIGLNDSSKKENQEENLNKK